MSKFKSNTPWLLLIPMLSNFALADAGAAREHLAQVMRLREKGKTSEAYAASLQAIAAVREDLRSGQVIQRISSSFTARYQETLIRTETQKEDEKFDGGIRELFGLTTGTQIKTQQVDTTRILALNPEETARMPQKAREELARLKQDLISYINTRSEEIVILKALGALYFQNVIAVLQAGTPVPKEEMTEVISAVTELNFGGEQNITSCVSVGHVESKSGTESVLTNSRSWFGQLVARLTIQSAAWAMNLAYTETRCSSSVNSVTARPEDSTLWKVSLSRLDRTVQAWARAAILKSALSSADDLPFPTWDNPYYQ